MQYCTEKMFGHKIMDAGETSVKVNYETSSKRMNVFFFQTCASKMYESESFIHRVMLI